MRIDKRFLKRINEDLDVYCFLGYVFSHQLFNVFDSKIIIWMIRIMCLLVFFIKTENKKNKKKILQYSGAGIVVILLILQSLFYLKEIQLLITWVFIPFIMGLRIKKIGRFNKALDLIALLMVVNFFLNFLNKSYLENYMDFGYLGILPFMILINNLNNKRILRLVLSLVIIILVGVYGSRGALLSGGIFLAYRLKIGYKLVLSLAVVLTLLKEIIYILVLKIINYFQVIGIKSYIFLKIKEAFEKGVVKSSSGRDFVFNEAIEMFMDSPILGHGMGYYRENNYRGLPYSHKIFWIY